MASQSGWSLGSAPCPSERQALRHGEDAFLWFLWLPVFLGEGKRRLEHRSTAQERSGAGLALGGFVPPAARLQPVLPLASPGSPGSPGWPQSDSSALLWLRWCSAPVSRLPGSDGMGAVASCPARWAEVWSPGAGAAQTVAVLL